MLNEKIKKYLKFGIIVFCCIIVLFGFVYAQDVIDLLTISEKDIVLNNYVKWESPLVVCDYKDYYQPKSTEYKQTLSSVLETKKGYVKNLGVEVLQTTNWNESKYVEEQWIGKSLYDDQTKANYTLWDVIPRHNETIPHSESTWVKNITSFKPKTLYHIRQCFSRNNVLDNFEIDVSIPFMNFDMKQFTAINSSGYNDTTFSKLEMISEYWNFDNDYTSGTNMIGYFGRANGTIVGATTNQTGFANQSYRFTSASSNYVKIKDNDIFSFTNATTGGYTDVPFMICGAIKKASVGTTNSFVCKYNDSGAGSITEYVSYTDTSNIFGYNIYSRSSNANYLQVTSGTNKIADITNFHRICIYYNGLRNKEGLNLFINATNVSTQTLTGTYYNMTNTKEDVYLGTVFVNSFLNLMNGWMDDVIIYKNYTYNYNDIVRWNSTDRNFLKGIYGAYNSTATFNQVWFNFTGAKCNATEVNISTNTTSFMALSGDIFHNFANNVSGFYLRVNTDKCSAIWLNATNQSLPSNIVIIQVSPPTNSNTSELSQDFICNATDYNDQITAKLQNVSLLINNIEARTNTTPINNSNITLTYNFNTGNLSLNWSCKACNNVSLCNTTSNYIFTYIDSCYCHQNENWNLKTNCTISSDCDITPYNFSCISGNILNITNGALFRFNSTLGGFNCSYTIKNTGLLSG